MRFVLMIIMFYNRVVVINYDKNDGVIDAADN